MRVVFSEDKVLVQTPAIFLDRDGVLNYRKADDYVLDWSQFEFVIGIRSAMAELGRLNLPMIIVSNQSAVGRGFLPPATLRDLTVRLHAALLKNGAFLTAFYYCTHHPDEKCVCRKPNPHMLFQAASDFNVDLQSSVFIGDSDSDVLAARAAGCAPVLFGSGLTSVSESSDWMRGVPNAAVPSELFEVVRGVLAERASRNGLVPYSQLPRLSKVDSQKEGAWGLVPGRKAPS